MKPDKKPFDKVREKMREQRIIELSDKSIEVLAAYVFELEQELRKRDSNEAGYERIIEKLKARIGQLEDQKKPKDKYVGYDKSKSGVEKIVFILKHNKDGLTFSEIIKVLLGLEPELKDRWSNVGKAITHLLIKGCRYRAFYKTRVYGENGYFIYHPGQSSPLSNEP